MTLYFPPHKFKSAPLTKSEWQRRWAQFAVADYAEGARRDRYAWSRFREPYSARLALPAEYDGARIAAGLPMAEHRHAMVIVRAAGQRLERLFLPLERKMAPESMPAHRWFQLAEDWGLWNDWSVIEDQLSIERGRRDDP